MKKRILGVLAGALSLSATAMAAPITIGAYTFDAGEDAFASSATVISGAASVFGGITCAEGLTGSDIDTGCFNMSSTDVVRLDYATSFANGVGDDLVFTDSRFSADGLDFSLDGVNFFNLSASDFTDTGVDSVIRNEFFAFDLFAVAIDLADFGFAADAVFSSIWLRGTGQSDPVFVGALNSVQGGNPVPLPGAALLFASAIAGFGAWRRKQP